LTDYPTFRKAPITEALIDIRAVLPEETTLEKLASYHELVKPKATTIAAAFEFARRRIKPEGLKIKFPVDVLPLIQHYGDRKQEHFLCVSINGANEVMNIRVVTIGLLNKSQVHPREVFADVIAERASAVIVAHNHPNGELKPSNEDIAVTKTIKEAASILGIGLLDHIIFNNKGYYSFVENNEL
jgi:DNA repair protein RadC